MKKYIIIAALSIGSTLSAMDNHITTMISTPKSDNLYSILREKNLSEKQATELSQCIGGRTLPECIIYQHVTKIIFNHHIKKNTHNNLFVQTNDLVEIIKNISIILDKKNNPIDNIINGRPAKL